ncbi:hypothetical protein V9T40_008081 [Parthenolecanium corni]|uniref:Uncharacterized protein n=1 Tax=Parthenolecanium corni TaxID=536013 RepID=A0AAN9Y9A0_9HEMI
MKVFLAFCLVASAFAYPQYARYDSYLPQQEAQPKPCSVCRANQEILRQTGSPVFQTTGQPNFRYDRSIVIEETEPILINSAEPEPVFMNAPSTRPNRGISEESVPVLLKTAEGIVEDPVRVNPKGPSEEVIIQETTGPVAERVVMLREEDLKRESRSPDDAASVPVITTSSFDDLVLPLSSDLESENFMRRARSVIDEPSARVTRSAMPQVIPILTNIPAENIDGQMIESILRSARSIQSADSTNVAAPAVTEQQSVPVISKEIPPAVGAGKAPLTLGMYYIRVKSYNYLDDDLPAALKEASSTTSNKPCAKEQEELQKKYFEQEDKAFMDFMQQLLVQQFTSLLEQQMVQQQDQLKKFLNKQLEDELKTTTPSVPTTTTPVTPVSGDFAASKAPGSSPVTAEKIEVAVVEPVAPVSGKDLETSLKEKV